MPPSTVTIFSCSICFEPLGESTSCFVKCGHVFHLDCIEEWFYRSETQEHSCPNCRIIVEPIITLNPLINESYKLITTEELDSLRRKLNDACEKNLNDKFKETVLTSKLYTSKNHLKKSRIAVDNVVNALFSHDLKRKKELADYKFNEERSKRILLQKEVYNYQARITSEFNELKSEIENLKLKKLDIQSKNHDFKQPSTSSKKARRENALPCQIQSPKLQPSTDGFLSNCHFWVVNEYKKISGATNHQYFNENRIMEHGGTVAYHYTNMVTHVIGISSKNADVILGLNQHKKCVTDYWLSDIIGEKKMKKPWMVHHFPIPYSVDELPYEHKQIAIANFQIDEYHKIKAMVEITGATVINKISSSTFIVISLKLEGEMIKKALSLKIPVVNVQWITDILLGEEIGLKHFKRKKYQKFDLRNPYRMNYKKVSTLMEAWDKRPKVPTFKIPNKKIVEPTMTNKRIKTCVIQELLQSGVNNGDGNSSFRTTSILSIPMATESRIISPNGEIDEQEIKKGEQIKINNNH
ncbi:PAX-interacting protein 1-like isoform X3 [Acyrthosiphon pisum]|uniref:PAX-interacting protein 1 n=1 Tax=Acyrthosiphon pisum TaxID=7029 RepID=A0A8R2D7I9_ACYPI|nr:PAX-interacting protein 1-like isoform X3 [Acyrthosiphon pisum]|eukprot:XP_016664872.1 PREDICTED: PAX-interacting protein 1-like isoform X3 [Acyrthosiphon pisum]